MQMEEGFVWIQTTWCEASNAQQKHGEKPSITKTLYQNGYLELKDDGFPIHDKALMMKKYVPLGYVPSLTLSTIL
jgi:hypothetical protein